MISLYKRRECFKKEQIHKRILPKLRPKNKVNLGSKRKRLINRVRFWRRRFRKVKFSRGRFWILTKIINREALVQKKNLSYVTSC